MNRKELKVSKKRIEERLRQIKPSREMSKTSYITSFMMYLYEIDFRLKQGCDKDE
jgi:hypothetical protein